MFFTILLLAYSGGCEFVFCCLDGVRGSGDLDTVTVSGTSHSLLLARVKDGMGWVAGVGILI